MSHATATDKAVALGALGPVFQYPSSSYKELVNDWIEKFQPSFPSSSRSLQRFADTIQTAPVEAIEEIYTRTFDMAPVCSPYISGHIYGDENFERGTLLTALNDRYVAAGFSTDGELPDHLAVLLRFAPEMTDEELADLCDFCLSKPIDDMISSLSGNPYEHALKAVRQLLHDEGSEND